MVEYEKDLTISMYRAIEHGVEAARPIRATSGSAAYDITAFCPEGHVILHPLRITPIRTGLTLAAPPNGTFLVCSRSGLARRGVQVINAPGIIDSDYREEILVLLTYIAPPGEPGIPITHGLRIAQLLYMPPPDVTSAGRYYPEFREVAHPSDLPGIGASTRRGGFGSTGLHSLA